MTGGLLPRLARLRRRIDGPKVLVTSLPKSGTHLLLNALLASPGMRLREGGRNWSLDAGERERLLGSIGRGEVLYGHYPYGPRDADILRRCGARVVLMLRDPRDVAVSLAHYILKQGDAHRLGPYFRDRLPDFDARLMACIRGVSAEESGAASGLEDLGTRFRSFLGWAREGAAHLCRFEDLVGARGGGSEDLQRRALGDLYRFVGLPSSGAMVEEAALQLYSTGSTTFRKGVVGDWKEHFKPSHVEAFAAVMNGAEAQAGYGPA
ncbi:MAG: hypothetical protein ACOYXN_10725 [Acidobacteriota bacterium]